MHSLWRALWLEGHADLEYIPHPAFHRLSFHHYADEGKGSICQPEILSLTVYHIGPKINAPNPHTYTTRVEGDRSP